MFNTSFIKRAKYYLAATSFAVMILTIGFLTIFQSNEVKQSRSQNQISASADLSGSEAKKNEKEIAEIYGKLPLTFEPNAGQTDENARFISRGHGYALFLRDTEAVFALQKKTSAKQIKTAIVKMKIAGANSEPKSVGFDETESKTNYLLGEDSAKWQTNVANYRKVKFENVYSGVDLVYYGNQRQLEYDFLVAPNANAKQIRLNFDGIKKAEIEKQTGDLLLETAVGTIRQHKPVAYQEINGERREIAVSYLIQNPKSKIQNWEIGFQIGEYDESKPLVIDPIFVYSSYLGGNMEDVGRDIAVDGAGNAYIIGNTISPNFPVTNGAIKTALQPRTGSNVLAQDCFVSKINPTGTALVYSTYIGGRDGNEVCGSIGVDNIGNAYLTGFTDAADFPRVNSNQNSLLGGQDAFVSKINSTGSAFVYSTLLGGTSADYGTALALNKQTGEVFASGYTTSADFPTTAGALKPASCASAPCAPLFSADGYVTKYNANGAVSWSTLFGGTSGEAVNDIAVDANGNSYIVGTTGNFFTTTAGAFQTTFSGGVEGFLSKINSTGTAFGYSTYLGGGLQSDRIFGVAVDAEGNAYVAGQTENIGFPTTPNAFDISFNGGADAFVTKFNAAGSALVYSTFLGGSGTDKAFAIKIGGDGNAFVVGETTNGAAFPLRNSLQGNVGSMFLTRLNSDASNLVYSTLLGTGSPRGVDLDANNNAFLAGEASNIPTTPGVFQPAKGNDLYSGTHDGFVMKIAPADEAAQTYSISGRVFDGIFADYTPVVVTLSGTVNRTMTIAFDAGSGSSYFFGNLPVGGNYTVTARKIGYLTDPENAVFTNLQANQFADFRIQPNQKPIGVITSPAHGATFNAPGPITIRATASDPDNHPIAKVDFVAYSSTRGSFQIGTDATAPYEITWNNVPADVWALYAIPVDSLGLRGDSTPVVHITVVDPTTPTVTLTSPANGSSFAAGSFVPVSASVSSSIQIVEFYEGNNLIGRRTNAPWSFDWRPMTPGNFTIYAKGYTATNQAFTSASVNVTVTPFNHRISGRITDATTSNPVANVNVALTGTNSISANTTTDAGGNYLFTNLNATPNDSVTITPSANGLTFTPANRNISYLGYIDWEYQHFTTVPLSNVTVSLISPTSNQQFTAPATINLAAEATTTSGTIAKVEFFYSTLNGARTLLATDTTAPYSYQWTNVAAGNYAVIAKATDSNGTFSESSAVITVNPQPTTVRINGQVRDPNGNGMAGISLSLTGSQTQTAVTNTLGYYVFTNLPSGGNYTIASTNSFYVFTPPTRTFTNLTSDVLDADFVTNTTNQPPTVRINSPANGATFTMPVNIPINATATDADGSIVHFSMVANNGNSAPTIGQSNNGTLNFPWQVNLPGTYTLTAIARDNGGLQSTASIQITVNRPAPVSISGRIVDRNSAGIEGVKLTLRNYPQDDTTIATATTNANGNYTIPNVPTFANYIL